MTRPLAMCIALLMIGLPGRAGQIDARTACIEGDMLSCALVLARQIKKHSSDHALHYVAKGFAEAGRLEEAQAVIAEIKGKYWRPEAKAAVVSLLARRGQHAQALKMALASKNFAGMVALGDLYIKTGDLARAESTADKMTSRMSYAKVSLLEALAKSYHAAGKAKEAAAKLTQLEKFARAEKERIPRSDFLLRVAELSVEIEMPGRAVKLAMQALADADEKNMTKVQRMMHHYYPHKVGVRASVFRLLLKLGRLDQASKLARQQPEVGGFHAMWVTRSDLLENLVKAYIAKGQHKKARSLLKGVKPSDTCGSRGLQAKVASSYDLAGNEARALKMIAGLKDRERMWGICELAEGRLEVGKFESALKMAEKIEKSVFLVSCLNAMAKKALDAKRQDWAKKYTARAIEAAGREDMLGYRSYGLTMAGELLFKMGKPEQALGLIERAKNEIKHEEEKYKKDRWEDILDALADAGYCDLAVESTAGVAMSDTDLELAADSCARQECFAAAVKLAARLPRAETRAKVLAQIGGRAGRDGWKPDAATLEILRNKILDAKK
jgi:tetratricopeptide (TPR) repeat protein